MTKLTAVLALLILIATGCKKESVNPTSPSLKKDININFSSATIAIADVVSTDFKITNANNDVIKQGSFTRSNNLLSTSVDSIAKGTYDVEIKINTKKQVDGSARQYRITKSIRLPLSNKIEINAPKGDYKEEWFKRAILYAEQDKMVAIVSMDPRDAYYSLRFKEARWKVSGVQRETLYHNVALAVHFHQRLVGGVLSFDNYTSFNGYVNELKDKQWTKGVISIWVVADNGEEVYIDYNYNKN